MSCALCGPCAYWMRLLQFWKLVEHLEIQLGNLVGNGVRWPVSQFPGHSFMGSLCLLIALQTAGDLVSRLESLAYAAAFAFQSEFGVGLFQGGVFTLTVVILSHFAAERKQLVHSHALSSWQRPDASWGSSELPLSCNAAAALLSRGV